MDALCALDHHRDGGIIVGAKFVLSIDVLQMGKASREGSSSNMSCHVITGKVLVCALCTWVSHAHRLPKEQQAVMQVYAGLLLS